MAISRRKFVRAGALVFVAAGIPVAASGSQRPSGAAGLLSSALGLQTPSPHGVGPTRLTRDLFTPHLNSQFRIRVEERTVKVQLIKISDEKAAGITEGVEIAGKESFSLIFLGMGPTSLEQQTYEVEHDEMGKLNLFLVPVGRNTGTQHYQAAFTRI